MPNEFKPKPKQTRLVGREGCLIYGGRTVAYIVRSKDCSYFSWKAGDSGHGIPYKSTTIETVATVQAAKADALAYVKEHLKR